MTGPNTLPTLAVKGLTTEIPSGGAVLRPVDDVSFEIHPGQIMGLVGESGSGKSMTAFSILRMLDAPGRISAGSIQFQGKDLRALDEHGMRDLRGNRIAMIFQDPATSLNPVLRIDTQMIEAITAHRRIGKRAARDLAREALAKVGITSPDERLLAYPHQFSGGMRQRVAIAIAMLNKPDLIICDEPTTALDVTIQAQILAQMQALCREAGTALIWITHDLAVVAGFADTVAVMYAGRIVEIGTVERVLQQPRHPYTHGLIASAPSRNPRGQPLPQIRGMVPPLSALPDGCAFRDRCARATSVCHSVPALEHMDGRLVRCFHPVMEEGA
ncbi:peptide/nickel transport system ATP-binding protein [Paucimonas lemoignei]|uniref:Peptide/nickel transport system ATP-binding protein n=1 Tax=Paucimonas lemoignei TaxID=29443 RepID=A0A4R3HTW5_PAULE|nr:ABC transporter ATP-binding protein [Paucimonas lemoignei]TCS36646.1 peptide/nickel transport system ATP-binding protein [Paucimonas lemoignei]